MRPPDPLDSTFEPPRTGAAFCLAGPGFHTGRWNRLRLSASQGRTGSLHFNGRSETVWGEGSEPVAMGRCTTSRQAGPLEHLSAAALVCASGGWILEADHHDLPLFDGSAAIWRQAFAAIGMPRSHGGPNVAGFEGGRWLNARAGFLEVEPSNEFRLRVEWSPGPLGEEVWEGNVADLAGILPARTFVEVDDWLMARREGWLQGTGFGSGRLLRGTKPSSDAIELAGREGVDPDQPVWSGAIPRMPNECAAHKALDLVGDIGVWIGYLPGLSIHARDAGHDLHHLLGAALRRSLRPD